MPVATIFVMETRINYVKTAPGVYHAMEGLTKYLEHSELGEVILGLVRLRASQINAWNRLAISARVIPGKYEPARKAA